VVNYLTFILIFVNGLTEFHFFMYLLSFNLGLLKVVMIFQSQCLPQS